MSHSLKFAIIAGGLMTMTGGLVAFADHHRGSGHHQSRLEAVDTNGDGNVTRAELDAQRAEKFAQADANGDGAVSFAEMEAFRETERARRQADRAQRRFEMMDADGDGAIGPDEFGGRAERMFDRVDTDGDGVITEDERSVAKDRMRQHRGKRGERRGTRD